MVPAAIDCCKLRGGKCRGSAPSHNGEIEGQSHPPEQNVRNEKRAQEIKSATLAGGLEKEYADLIKRSKREPKKK